MVYGKTFTHTSHGPNQVLFYFVLVLDTTHLYMR